MKRSQLLKQIEELGVANVNNNYENLKEWLYLNGTRLYNVVGIEVEREEDDYIVCQIALVDGYGESFGSVQYCFYK